jgi:ubiquinone/menaquinone biosynthesis C-methylase UbiE
MPTTLTDEQELFDWNEAMARRYDPESYHLRSNWLIRWIERRRVRAILDLLDGADGHDVLEVGCGAGNVLERVTAAELYGLDLSPYLLAKAQRRLWSRQAKLIQANAETLPFRSGRFKRLICTEVLEHVRDPRRVIAEIARIAAPGSVIVISVPNEGWIDSVKKMIRGLGLGHLLLKGQGENAYSSPDEMTDAWHLHRFNLALLYQVSGNILRVQTIRRIPFVFLPLRYVVAFELITR